MPKVDYTAVAEAISIALVLLRRESQRFAMYRLAARSRYASALMKTE